MLDEMTKETPPPNPLPPPGPRDARPEGKLEGERVHDLYKEAGVDTDEAESGLQRLTKRIAGTWPPANAFGAVKLPIGYFANVVDIGGQGIAISTDGIGSKAKIAWELKKFDTVGIDCVAMNVNDIICVGARPISMVDYVAIEEVKADILDAISIGLCQGARTAGISISGGETAQLKGMVHGFDLAGTAIGHVALDRILIGEHVREGDVVVGAFSNGIHSNGMTLARRALFERGGLTLGARVDELGCDLGSELLKPTHIYVREAMALIERVSSLKALIHITSDGFLNLTRVKADVGYVLDTLPEPPAIFKLIQRLGGIDDAEMFSVFNMGIGFCAIVSSNDADTAVSILGSRAFRAQIIGRAVTDATRTVSIPQHRLKGRHKHFRRE